MPVKLAYSTNAFKKFSLEEAIRQIALLGFSGVEIMADRPHLYPSDYADPKKMDGLKKALKDSRLAISNLNTFTLCAIGDMHHPSWIEKEPELREIRIRHTKDCLVLAKELSCPNISIQPGGKLEHFSRSEAEKIFLDGLGEVIPLAKKLGVRILIEPEPALFMENSTQFLEFIAKTDRPTVGLNFDIGHFHCAGEDAAEQIIHLKDHIGHMHIEDIMNRLHAHLICGLGEINFITVFEAVRKIGYQGFISLELYPYQNEPVEAGRKSLEHLKKFI